jgi:hypothetical protein
LLFSRKSWASARYTSSVRNRIGRFSKLIYRTYLYIEETPLHGEHNTGREGIELRSVFALQHVARAILEIGRNESPMQGYSEIHTSTVVINLANLFGHLVRIDLILGFEASIHIPMEDCGGTYGKILVDFKFILQRECKAKDSQTREVYFCI